MKNTELLELIIDEEDESGVDFIALVDSPATESLWLSFNKQQEFKIEDEEKRIVSGYFMKADLPIIRLNDNNEKYYVVFRRDTIEKIVNKFFKNGLNANVNLMHDNNLQAKGVYVIESLIIDSKRGIKAPKGFEDAPDGSWWGSMRVENDEIWAMVKDGSFRGFSVEGMFGQAKTIKYPVTLINKIREVVKKYKQKKKNNFVSMVVDKDFAIIDDRLAYASKEMALKAASDLGIEGIHEHEYNDKIWYMVGETHEANMYKKCPPGYIKKNGKCVKSKY